MKIIKALLFLLLCWQSAFARADTVIFVHGFLGNVWSFAPVSQALQRNGWQRGGVIMAKSKRNMALMLSNVESKHRFIAVGLPSYAPIKEQAQLLEMALKQVVRLFPTQNIHLVAHSAGGVVARLLLVKAYVPQIKSLITITTPHLGTRRAEFASDMTDLPFPMRMMAETMGGRMYDEFQEANVFFNNLSRPRPGNFLYWLNIQPHPPIQYVAIVHRKTSFFDKDFMVPAYSQSMEGVPALKGQTKTIEIKGKHSLNQKDGAVVAQILRGDLRSK